MKAFNRTTTYLWIMAMVLFTLLVKPYTVEIVGMRGGAAERPGTVSSIRTVSHYNAQDNYSSSTEIYTFRDDEGNSYQPSSFSRFDDLRENDRVTLGVVYGRLATVNDRFVGQVGFFERLGFGLALALFVFARTSQRFESRDKEQPLDSPWLAMIVTAVMVLPALIVGFITVALSFVGEMLGIALWPLILLATALIISQLLCRRMDKKRT